MIQLKRLRESRSIRQEDVAKLLNISIDAYAHYENGIREPSITSLIKLAHFFSVTVDYLLKRRLPAIDMPVLTYSIEDINERLRQLRVSKGLSQQSLADIMGKQQSTIAKYELGQSQADYETIRCYAEFFDVTVDWIFGVRNNISGLSLASKNGKGLNSNVRDKALEQIKEAKENSRIKEIIASSDDTVCDKEHYEGFDLKNYIRSVIREYESEKDRNDDNADKD